MFWRAAKVTYKQEFDRVIDELKEIDANVQLVKCSLNNKMGQKRVATLETLKASKNASKYMEAIMHAGSQSSVQGPNFLLMRVTCIVFLW